MFEAILRLIGLHKGKQSLASSSTRLTARSKLTDADIIRDWAVESGLTNGREEDFNFLMTAKRAGKFNGRDLRKFGEPLPLAERKALGLSGRTVYTREFLAILSPAGMADPEGAAWMLTLPANNRLFTYDQLRGLSVHGPEMKARFHASDMAAGPCKWAAARREKVFQTADAPLLPVPECTHPDQCACRYQAHLAL